MLEKLKHHYNNKIYAKFIRAVGKKCLKTSSGYVVGYSDDFVLLQEAGDFEILGYNIFPIAGVKKIRYNKWDKYYNKIMICEGEVDKVGITYDVDLRNWKTIFESINNRKLNVVVECEDPSVDSFTIGPIIKIAKKKIYINNFDPAGYLDEEPTSIDYESITNVQFDDRYANIFSKYLRTRKAKHKIEPA